MEQIPPPLPPFWRSRMEGWNFQRRSVRGGWGWNIQRNVILDSSTVTVDKVAIIFFELTVIKNFKQGSQSQDAS